jgi:hypothetical protein
MASATGSFFLEPTSLGNTQHAINFNFSYSPFVDGFPTIVTGSSGSGSTPPTVGQLWPRGNFSNR